MEKGDKVRTPFGVGTVVNVTSTAVDPWATVEVDGIEDEFLLSELKTERG